MRPERAGAIMAGMLTAMARWEEELAEIQPAPGSEKAKHHLLASLGQSRQSLRQLIERSGSTEF